jgi:phosphatidylglycerophosphate synthase
LATSSPATPRQRIVVGIGLAAAGVYFVLVGAGVQPPPGGSDNLHAPLWVVVCLGLLILISGMAIVIQGVGRGNSQGELAADAPTWLHAGMDLIGPALFALLAMIGSWVAIGGDPRQFSGSSLALGLGSKVTMARVVFGIGALICWAAAIGYAVSGVRRLRRRRSLPAADGPRR